MIIESADVAGIDTYGGTAGVDRREDIPGLEVNVGDHRDLGLLGDDRQCFGVVLAGYGDPTLSPPVAVEPGRSSARGVDVRGQGRRHRLHADRRITADGNLADLDLPALATRCEGGVEEGLADPGRCS